ncbi:hypothetical protein LV476_11075 [Guyparkeria hydrothermalis]|uniref:COG1470 family protein n=1 Tax=Guyparkeria hydrothermalis TaxID=923 RepID=UPI002020328D|nr:hypothetical protein [Guyparkeria hydrothermalis]MCL7745477.1 hypothetical protein [Guyparkeria hydrothermalis]
MGHAFHLLADPSDREKAQLDEWVDFLLQEGDVHQLIERLKARGDKAAAEKAAADKAAAEKAADEKVAAEKAAAEKAAAEKAAAEKAAAEKAAAEAEASAPVEAPAPVEEPALAEAPAEAAVQEEGGEYAGSAEIVDAPREFQAGMPETILVSIENNASFTWENTEDCPINASYHWLNAAGEMECFDGIRTPLEGAIAPGERAEVEVRVEPPSEPGDYELVLTMVHEGVTWFEEQGFKACVRKIQVDEYSGYGLSRQARDIFMSLNRRSQVMEVAA